MKESPQRISPLMTDAINYLRTSEDAHGDHGGTSETVETTVFSRGIGALYEKLRFAVDNKEEHFFRRHAIRRALRRGSLFVADPEKLLATLILDLARGGYLTPGQLSPERKRLAGQSLGAFALLQQQLKREHDVALYHTYRPQLLDIISGALEDALFDTSREDAVVVMMARVGERVITGAAIEKLDAEEKMTLFYVAAWRSLFTADASLLRYKLWLFFYPLWDHGSPDEMKKIAEAFPYAMVRINRTIEKKLGRQLLPKFHDLSIAHTLLYDALCEYGDGLASIIGEPELFALRLREFIEIRYRRDMLRANRRSLRAIGYIFMTKATLAIGVESLYVLLWKQALNYVSILINLVFHPALLFFLTSGLHTPSARNTDRAVDLVFAIVYDEPMGAIVLRKETHGILMDTALGIYLALFGTVMWGVIIGLQGIGFHLIDIIFFNLFLLLVLYFGFRIRFAAQRMRFTNTKDGFFRSAIELLLLPFVSLGRWMSLRFEQVNFAVLFLDFVIEAPLRLLLRFFDTFTSFIEKKRDEIYAP